LNSLLISSTIKAPGKNGISRGISGRVMSWHRGPVEKEDKAS
jgi:hypothetical protein